MKQVSQEDKSYHQEYFQRNVSRLQLVKEVKKIRRGNKTFTRVSFNKRGEKKKKPEKLFPIFKKEEQNKDKWSGFGHFPDF